MKDFLRQCFLRNPNSTINDYDKIYTYHEFLELVEKKYNQLISLEIQKAKCIIACENEFNTALWVVSCFFADMIPIVVSCHYGRQLFEKIIDYIEPNVIILDTNDVCEIEIKNKNVEADSELNDVSLIMCTSGTTGSPKGAMFTSSAIQSNIEAISHYFEINNEDKILITRPLYHCAALVGEFMTALYCGTNIVFCNQIFSPNDIIIESMHHNVTVLGSTPTMLKSMSMFIRNDDLKISKLAISGECLNHNVSKVIRRAFPDAKIYCVYGLTEAGPRVSYLPPELFDEYSNSVGIPLNNIKVKIIDNDNNEVPDGTSGIVAVFTPSVMKGYYKNNVLSNKALTDDGWLITGDIGHISNNLLYIDGRADDMIIKGGMNIYPKEIENQLNQVEQIKECIAYSVIKNDTQVIGIDVVLNETYHNMSSKELRNIIAKVLPAYQMPSYIKILHELEKGPTGKIIRRRS